MTLVDIIYDRILLAGLEGDDEVRINIASLHYILEEELTAVKGVDELINKVIQKYEKKIVDEHDFWGNSLQYQARSEFISDLKDLKQTPVAEEYPCTECGGNAYEGYIVEEGNCKIAKGERLCKKCMEKRNPDFIEQEKRLKDYQPKEVEKAKKCLQCGTHYNGGTINFCSSDCCLKWNGMK